MENNICVKEVIVSQQLTRGNGTESDPIRRVTTVHDKDGNLIAENDPDGMFTLFDVLHFCRWYCGDKLPEAMPKDLDKWINNIKK